METISKDVNSILRNSGAFNNVPSMQGSSQMASIFLQKWEKWLLAFDNADNIEIAYNTFTPPNASGPILSTSCNATC